MPKNKIIKTLFYYLAGVMFFSYFLGSRDSSGASNDQVFDKLRDAMVSEQIEARGIKNAAVLNAMRKVKRHLFVLPRDVKYAYGDSALPIEENQTISQPYIVALMTELAAIDPGNTVLEIGTGSGYQAAVLAEIAKQVYSVEIIDSLCIKARERLKKLGYRNIQTRCGDGYAGWPEAAPFDAILVTACAKDVPQKLLKQLKPGGRLVIPLGDAFQDLFLFVKNADGSIVKKNIISVRFVPLVKKE